MTVSEQRSELDEVVGTLACLEKGEAVTLVTDAGSISATVTAVRWHPDDAVATFEDRDADRRVRVRTERYDGWLDPLVDTYTSDSEFTFDFDDPDPDSLRPVGSLVDVRRESAADDQFERRGRP